MKGNLRSNTLGKRGTLVYRFSFRPIMKGDNVEKIRCPHCSAMNQDVEPADNCWQCGNRLDGAAVAPVVQVKQAVPQLGLEERVAKRKEEKKNDGTKLSLAMVIIMLLILTIIVVFVMLGHW